MAEPVNPETQDLAEDLPVSKLCREMLAGITSLKKWDTEECDEYLDFFGYVLDDLESETKTRRGSFPLIDRLRLEEGDEIRSELKEIDNFARKIKRMSIEERKDELSDEQVKKKVEKAKEIYNILEDIEKEHSVIN